MKGTTIQINTREGLERLLGDDETMEITVRRSVIEAFAKGFLKNIQKQTELKQLVETLSGEAETAIKKEMTRLVGQRDEGWRSKIYLNDKYKTLIKERVEADVDTLISQHLNSLLDAKVAEMEARFDELFYIKMNAAIDRKLNTLSQSGVESFIRAALEERQNDVD